MGPISVPATISGDLPGDRRGCPAKESRDLPCRHPGRYPTRDLLPLRYRKHRRTAASHPRDNTTMFGQLTVNSARCPVQRPCDLARRLTLLPPIPKLPALRRRKLPTLPAHPDPFNALPTPAPLRSRIEFTGLPGDEGPEGGLPWSPEVDLIQMGPNTTELVPAKVGVGDHPIHASEPSRSFRAHLTHPRRSLPGVRRSDHGQGLLPGILRGGWRGNLDEDHRQHQRAVRGRSSG